MAAFPTWGTKRQILTTRITYLTSVIGAPWLSLALLMRRSCPAFGCSKASSGFDKMTQERVVFIFHKAILPGIRARRQQPRLNSIR